MEIFSSIQGEAERNGYPSIFVRSGLATSPALDSRYSTKILKLAKRNTVVIVSIQSTQGNQIENSNIIQLNGNVSFDKLYNKVPYFKKVNQGKKSNSRSSPRTPQKQKQTQQPADTTKTKPKVNYFKIVGDGFLRLLMSVKRASLSYNQGNGTFLPGFKPQPGLIGNNWGYNAPGIGFAFGSQKDIRSMAVQNGWLTTDTLLNTAYVNKFSEQMN